jgi:ATP-dependent Clp protease protease subunit
LAAGEKGKRFALPHSRIMIHQPHVSGVGGQATDIEIHAREILKTREDINEILALHSGKDLSVVQDDTERDFWLGPEEAIEYGVVDSILTGRQLEAVSN